MARVRLDVAVVTTCAMQVVDHDGYSALSLSAVAERLGVGPSALYSHVDGLAGLQEQVAIESTRLLTAAIRNAAIGAAGDDALHAVAAAYRNHVDANPGHFTAILAVRAPGPSMVAAGDELESVFGLLAAARGVADAAAHARHTRSALHGFLVLEHTGTRGATADDDYQALVEMLCRMVDR